MITISILRMNISDFFPNPTNKIFKPRTRHTLYRKRQVLRSRKRRIGSSCTSKLNKTMAMQVDLELKKVSKIKYSLYGKKIVLTFTLPIQLLLVTVVTFYMFMTQTSTLLKKNSLIRLHIFMNKRAQCRLYIICKRCNRWAERRLFGYSTV